MLAKPGGTQEPFDNFCVGIWRSVVNKCLNLARRRRQSCESESDTADERTPVRRRRRLQTGSLNFRQEKTIDRMRGPIEIRYGRNGWFVNWFKTPPIFARRED